MRTFQGVWPAIVTPFSAQGQVDEEVARRLVEHLIANGADGFYVCGSTGQGMLMAVAERRRMAAAVVEQVARRVPVIVHVGAVAIPDAVDLARHAREIGADGISSSIPPVYQSAEDLAAYYSRVGAAVPELPLLPYILGAGASPLSLIKSLLAIPTLGGTKYTGPNMYDLKAVVELRSSGWSVFSGMDEQCVYAAMAGAHGAIGSTINLMPGMYRRIRAHVAAWELEPALALQERANRLTAVLIAAGYEGALREALSMLGFDCGEPRLPGRTLDARARRGLRSQLKKAGFEDVVSL